MSQRAQIAFVCVVWAVIICGWIIPKNSARVGGGPSRKSELATTKSLLDSFELNCGRYPTTNEGLPALQNPPHGLEKQWRGPYGSHPIVNDTWGFPYEYTSENPHQFKLISYGKDGKPGGEGDDQDLIVNE